MISVNHLLTVFNSAFNFLIYWSFCCGKRRRRRSRRQRMLLSQKTQHSFEMQTASVANEATLLRRSRHDTGNGNHSHIVPSQACQLRIIAFHSGEHAIQAAASSPTSMGSVTNNANDILRTRGGGGGGEGDNVGKIEQPQTCVHPEIFLPTLPKLFDRG